MKITRFDKVCSVYDILWWEGSFVIHSASFKNGVTNSFGASNPFDVLII
jgi:hypothetical protein